jgi:ribosomal protein S12 methylthiotransferase accessory factor
MGLVKGSGFQLNSSIKHYTLDQDKVISPAETVDATLPKLKKLFDISNPELKLIDNLTPGAYSARYVTDQLTTSGKGLTPEQSQASAVMEFAERYSWLNFHCRDYDGYTFKSYCELQGGKTPLPPENYFLLPFVNVPDVPGLTEEICNIPLHWIKGTSLTDYQPLYYPINWHNMSFTSNGLAAGNTVEEALIQALCELIERENTFIFFQEKRPANEIDPRSLKNELVRNLLDKAAAGGVTIKLRDLTYDLGVATVLAYGVSRSDEGLLAAKGVGCGCHTDPEKAVVRALSEYFEGYSQIKAIQDKGKLDWPLYLKLLPKRHYGFLAFHNSEVLEQKAAVVGIDRLPKLSQIDIKQEVEKVVKLLRSKGHVAAFIDKTHPQLLVPVVRVFIPTFRLLNTEIFNPYFCVGEVYYEAGNKEQALKYAKKYLQADPLTGVVYERIRQNLTSADKYYRENYIENLKVIGVVKKDITDRLNRFGKLQ